MRHALAAAALALLAACDGLFSADLEIPEVRVTLRQQDFPESNTSDPRFTCETLEQAGFPCVGLTLTYDLGTEIPILDDQGVSYDLRLTDVALTLSATQTVTGEKNLSGIARATLRVLDDPAIAGSGVVLAEYLRPQGTGPVGLIAVVGNSSVDLGAYLDAGRLPMRVELVIDSITPTPAFTADVEAGFALDVNVDYGAYL